MASIQFGNFDEICLEGFGTSRKRNAKEAIEGSTKLFALIGTDCGNKTTFLALMPVDTDTSEDTVNRELINRFRCYEKLPQKRIVPFEWQISAAKTVVSVGSDSHIYCIGGNSKSILPCNEVSEFNIENPVLPLDGGHKMMQERAYAAVVPLDRKIYVFGGLPPFDEDSSPWAEFLDTTKPREEQEWKPLKNPISRHLCSKMGCTQLFAFPYDTHTVLIGCGLLPNQDGVLYNVADGSSSKYKGFPKICPWLFARPAVTDKTVYWIEDMFLWAYELDKRVYYRLDLSGSLFDEESFLSADYVPILEHLKDDLFGFFRLFRFDLKHIIVVECIKVQVRKGYPGSMGYPWSEGFYPGSLEVRVAGYQSYRCDPIYKLSHVVPI